MPEPRLRILAITQDFSRRNPGGWALTRILNSLAVRHEITCIGGTPRPEGLDTNIEYHRAFSVRKLGLLAGLLSFHLGQLLPWFRLTRIARRRFDVVQTIDAESLLGTVVTFQFCDAAFMELARRHHLFSASTLRGRLGSLNEILIRKIRTVIQRRVCRSRRTRTIIAVSAQLAEHLQQHYQPRAEPVVITNPKP